VAALSKSVCIRLLKKEDANALVKLYELIGWKLTEEHVIKWVEYSRRGKYSRIFVAELNGKVVGKITLDTAFPPYAEIVNVIVHPAYQKSGIGSKLIKECIKIATNDGYNIIYLMCNPVNKKIHRFYAKLGFIPGILGDPKDKRGDMWLYYFSEESFVRRFLKDHPFSEFHVSRGKMNFHGLTFYSIKWVDPITDDILEILIKGQPGQPESGGTMPRISGVRYKLKERKLSCWIQEENNKMFRNILGKFKLNIINEGEKEMSVYMKPLLPNGVELTNEVPAYFQVCNGEHKILTFKLKLLKNFDIPLEYLTFPTITASLMLKVDDNTEIVVSAGFE